MSKLTNTQLVILSASSQRKDGALLPFPKSVKLNKGALTSVLNSLLKQGLIKEQPAKAGEPHWREDKDQKLTLAITNKGMKAVGAKSDTAQPAEANAPKPPPQKAAAKSKAGRKSQTDSGAAKGTKQELLIDLLTRKAGATIDEVTKATGWQAHSVRGAISGTLKKKLGLTVESKVLEGRGRIYQIAGGR
jgi:hypothetical protein